MSTSATSESEAERKPKFQIAQIFVQHAGFQHRRPPLSIPGDSKLAPQEINVHIGFGNLNNGDAAHVVVGVETNPEDGDEKALYDFSVEYAAIVHDIDRTTFPDEQLAEVVAAMLVPFVRELVANITSRGRFGPVWINPFNVRAAVRDAFAAGLMQKVELQKENPTP